MSSAPEHVPSADEDGSALMLFFRQSRALLYYAWQLALLSVTLKETSNLKLKVHVMVALKKVRNFAFAELWITVAASRCCSAE
jgi:hypothetical protein